jgi:hypothetical protein
MHADMHVGLHDYLIILTKIGMCQQILVRFPSIIFYGNCVALFNLLHVTWSDMAKLVCIPLQPCFECAKMDFVNVALC